MRKYTLLPTLLFLAFICNMSAINAENAKKIHVNKAGTLVSHLTEEEANAITHLTLTGNINAIDFKHLRDEFNSLSFLDLSNAEIKMYTGKGGTSPDKIYVYPKNCIPAYAFCKESSDGKLEGKASLKAVRLSEKIWNIEDAAFKNCTNLQVLEIRKKKAPNLLSEALENTNVAIFVPYGSSDSYRMDPQWKSFAILEGSPTLAEVKIGAYGSLANELLNLGIQPNQVNFLQVEGKLDEADFKLIRNYMPNLVSVDIKKTSVKTIPEFTFTQKLYLTQIELPSQLEVIGERAFSNCERLSGDLILPSTMKALEYGAFLGCKNLRNVMVTGDHLSTIGEAVFDENNTHKLIYLKQETPSSMPK